MFREFFLLPFLGGISTGIFCISFCYPFLLPYFVAKAKLFSENIKELLKFLTGRFLGYVLFGAFAGFLGKEINSIYFNLFSFFGIMSLSLILIIYSLNLISKKVCCPKKLEKRTSLIFGFFTGINICPPFLISLFYIFTLKSILAGIAYFISFFFATSIYFLPLLGFSFLGRMREFQRAARISGIFVGVSFLIYSIFNIIKIIKII